MGLTPAGQNSFGLGSFLNVSRYEELLFGKTAENGQLLSITQTELPNAKATKRRSLNLSGMFGPTGSIPWSVSQRSNKLYYPGAREATPQLYGPDWGSTDFNFKWFRQYAVPPDYAYIEGAMQTNTDAGGDPLVVYIASTNSLENLVSLEDLVQKCEEMCAETALCIVEWGRKSRTGILSKFEATELRGGNYDVTISMDWVAADLTTKLAPPSWDKNFFEFIAGLFDKLIGYAMLPGLLLQQAMYDIEAAMNRVNTAIAHLEGLYNLYYEDLWKGVFGGFEGGGSFMSGIMFTTNKATEWIAALDQTSSAAAALEQAAEDRQQKYKELTTPPIYGSIVSAEASEYSTLSVIRSERSLMTIKEQASRLRRDVDYYKALILSMATDDLKTIHYATDGEDIRFIALRYYGDYNLWRALAKYNNVRKVYLPAGFPVKIPYRL